MKLIYSHQMDKRFIFVWLIFLFVGGYFTLKSIHGAYNSYSLLSSKVMHSFRNTDSLFGEIMIYIQLWALVGLLLLLPLFIILYLILHKTEFFLNNDDTIIVKEQFIPTKITEFKKSEISNILIYEYQDSSDDYITGYYFRKYGNEKLEEIKITYTKICVDLISQYLHIEILNLNENQISRKDFMEKYGVFLLV